MIVDSQEIGRTSVTNDGAAAGPEPIEAELTGLVVRARAGDLSAQSELIVRYRARLAGFVRTMVRDREAGKDILQSISLKLVRRIPGLREPAVFEPWLFTLARNTALDHLRRARCRPESPGRNLSGLDVQDASVGDRSHEILEAVEDALRGSSDTNRRILQQIISGATYRQVATAEGISISALKVRLHRLRQELRQRAGWALGDRYSRPRVSSPTIA